MPRAQRAVVAALFPEAARWAAAVLLEPLLGANEALGLLQGVNKLIVSKGRKVTKVNLKTDRPEDAELVRLLLGPTGNLRAPAIRSKKTLLVGFNLEAYESVLG